MHFDVKEVASINLSKLLVTAIAPRPIALVSTIDKQGNVNLSPFSFFNLFSYNPPIVIFSVTRKVRDNTTKHTLQNVLEVPEAVIHIVDDSMVQQVSLASGEFDKGINEFVKAGFTEEAATKVKPPMVKESNIKFECLVKEIKPLGDTGGSGNLIICEIIYIHVNDALLDEGGHLIQEKTQQVARAGGDWYSLTDKHNLFRIARPGIVPGIGIDALPEPIRRSKILTGNHLAQLASVSKLPDVDLVDNAIDYEDDALHTEIKNLVDKGDITAAWLLLLKSGISKQYS